MSAAKLMQRVSRKGAPQITVDGARTERRCECTRGIVCTGEAEGGYACGRTSGAWEHRFCTVCQDVCRQPLVPR